MRELWSTVDQARYPLCHEFEHELTVHGISLDLLRSIRRYAWLRHTSPEICANVLRAIGMFATQYFVNKIIDEIPSAPIIGIESVVSYSSDLKKESMRLYLILRKSDRTGWMLWSGTMRQVLWPSYERDPFGESQVDLDILEQNLERFLKEILDGTSLEAMVQMTVA